MPLCANELRDWVITTTLDELELNWPTERFDAARELLVATAAQESGLGYQMQSGRRLGIYQISPSLHKSIWDNFLIDNPDMASRVRGMAGQHSFLINPHGELLTNLKYATAIALMIYLRCGEAFPRKHDLMAMAIFWHRHFHPKAPSRPDQFVRNYRLHTQGHSHLVA